MTQLPNENLYELLTYLIPDWKWMEHKVSLYSYSHKREIKLNVIRTAVRDVTEKDLIQHLIDMLKMEEKCLLHYYIYRALHQLIYEIMVDEKNDKSIRDVIPAKRPVEYDEHLLGINEEFRRCLKLTLVGITYQFNYTFEEKVTDEKFELLEYLFTCQLSRFELTFGEYIEKEKRNLGSYYCIAVTPLVRFYYNIARNVNEDRVKYHFIKCQELIAHKFPEVEGNSFLITKFYEQRHVRIFDDSKKHVNEIKNVIRPVILCRVAMRLKLLGFPTGAIENNISQVNYSFQLPVIVF